MIRIAAVASGGWRDGGRLACLPSIHRRFCRGGGPRRIIVTHDARDHRCQKHPLREVDLGARVTRELGSRSLGRPHDPERRRRMAESYHRFRAMSADAQREYLTATATGKFQDGLGAVAASDASAAGTAARGQGRQ